METSSGGLRLKRKAAGDIWDVSGEVGRGDCVEVIVSIHLGVYSRLNSSRFTVIKDQ